MSKASNCSGGERETARLEGRGWRVQRERTRIATSTHPAKGFRVPGSGFGLAVPGSGFRVPGHLKLGTWHLELGTIQRDDCFQRAALPIGDDRSAGGHGLDGNYAELVLSRKDKGLASRKELGDFRIGESAQKSDTGAGLAPKAPVFLPSSDNPQWPSQSIERLDGQVNPLVRRKARHH